jgi:hypothetical protein
MRLMTVCAIALLVATACGGAASPAGGATTTAPTATTAAGAQATATKAAATSSGPNIADALKAGKASTYKVTYKWTTTAGGQTQTSEQTWYYKPPNARFDFSAGPGASFSIYALPDATYMCTIGGGSTFCQKTPGGQGAFAQNPAADFALQIQDKPDQFNAAFTGSVTIAGQSANCYSVKGLGAAAAGFGDVTTCYSSNGVPLKTSITAQGQSFTMEATAFSTNVSDADFVPPSR